MTLANADATDEARLTYMFRRTLSRPPTKEELNELQQLLSKQTRRLAEGWLNPAEIATADGKLPTDLPRGATPTQLAAYTLIARVLLNLDETITK